MTHGRFADVAAARGPEAAGADPSGSSSGGGGGEGGGRRRPETEARPCHERSRDGRASEPGCRLLVVPPLLTGQDCPSGAPNSGLLCRTKVFGKPFSCTA